MTFRLKLKSGKIKSIIEILSSIIDETEIKVSPDEFTIIAMDPSRICLLKVLLRKETFDEFECDKESRIGLNLDDLSKILKRGSAKDSLEFKYEHEDQKLKIKMVREEGSHSRTFSLSLLDLDYEEVPMDNLLNLEYNSTWVIDPEIFNEALKDAEIYSEILNMKAIEGEKLIFSSSGQIGEMNYELGLEDLEDININGKNTGSYSIDFLKRILKISSIIEKLEVSLKTDHPLKLIFKFKDGGNLSYFLAPRVEQEEDFDEDEFVGDEF